MTFILSALKVDMGKGHDFKIRIVKRFKIIFGTDFSNSVSVKCP